MLKMQELPDWNSSLHQKNEILSNSLMLRPSILRHDILSGYLSDLFTQGLIATVLCYSGWKRAPATTNHLLSLGFPVVYLQGGISQLDPQSDAFNRLRKQPLIITAQPSDLYSLRQKLEKFSNASYFDSDFLLI
jgi:hypothetical protein